MKKILLILSLIFMSITISGQSTPTTPIANAGVTAAGITYSYSENNTSIAISLAYNQALQQRVLNVVSANFPQFDGSQYVNDNSIYFESITTQGYSMKIELRLKNNVSSSNPDFQKAKSDVKKMYNEIYGL
ncbi:hypothetical protein [Chryseobacterium sp. c4a]|uniref:hypothetical protein n=1 Tax=Chryseobacterium sp. c4a TaxID=1573582 RepID=UPI001356C88C|nr:hypothetical protein [Chryseobacterium sp. c4a]